MTEAAVEPESATAAPAKPAADRRTTAVLIGLAVAVGVAVILRLLIGDRFGWPGWVVLEIRVQQAVMAMIVGAALSVGGALLQALLRNPLASPYLLGVSSGAAVGVMVSQMLVYYGMAAAIAIVSTPVAAAIGAMGSLIVVYLLSQKRGWVDPLGLVLVGVIVNAINGAAVMFINYLAPRGMRGDIALWMMGFLNTSVDWWMLLIVAAVTVAIIVFAVFRGHALDLATFSDAEAHSMGINLQRLRLVVFALAGLLTAGTVLLAGPIGFVGLICPHAVRLMIGPRHRSLLIGSALAGAALLLGADVIVQLLVAHTGQFPIGAVMALIGGPVFLMMLRPQLGRGGGP
jgi:iron complex transport system permease protein